MKQIIYLFLSLSICLTSCRKDCKTVPISQCTLLDAITMQPIQTNDCNCPPDRVLLGNTCQTKADGAYYGYSQGCDSFLDTLKVFPPQFDNVGGNDKGVGLGNGYIKFLTNFLFDGSATFRYYEERDSFYMPLVMNTAFKDKYCRASASLVYLDNKKQMRLTFYYNLIEDLSQRLGSCEMILKKP